MARRDQNPLRRLASSIQDMRERHRERHRPSGFGFIFSDRIDFLDPIRWDAIASTNSIFLKRDVLRVIEKHGPDNIHPRYAMVFRDDTPVAILAAQVVGLRGDQFQPDRQQARPDRALLQRVIEPAARAASSAVRERLLIAGNLLSWGFDGIGFAPGEDPAPIWPGVAEAVYRIRRAERLTGQTNFVLVKDLTAEHDGVQVLRRYSYRPMETEPNMVLAIEPSWRHYDDYLAALDAKYRRNAKDQIKKLTAAGCTVERLDNLDSCARRLHELYLAVHNNAPVRLMTLPETYLPAIARAAGQEFRCTVIRRGEELLGFVTAVRNGETAVAYFIGFDRAAAAAGLPLYLRLLHATIGDAIDWRCKRLSLGRTALEPKAALGAKPEPMFVWMRHRVPALNWCIRGLLGAVPHADAPERNPFKKTSNNG